MNRRSLALSLSSLSSAILLVGASSACSSSGSTRPSSESSSNTGGRGGIDFGKGTGGTSDNSAKGTCGDANLTRDEACDDGNTADDDGCASDCASVDIGYSCGAPGTLCRPVALCGDGVVTAAEPCDDDNQDPGDGCYNCRLERGYQCTGSPSLCSPTTCGDGMVEGTEGCDDGNTIPFDGCSSNCDAEPDCSAGACKSRCGDRIVLGEDCDDGNTKDGDGCSSLCKLEPGYQCSIEDIGCEKVGGNCVLKTDAIYRDFTGETTGEHPDFTGSCSLALVPGLVEPKLDKDGKPVLVTDGSASACITSQASFRQWYRKDASNVEVPGVLTLFDNGNGGFVNRYGATGEAWVDANGKAHDGSPLFFPIDGKGKGEKGANACINSKYGKAPPSYESVPHNFHFTTEVTHWFKYDESRPATLAFTGDDDVWVFLNGVLAVDLGGIHHPSDGAVTIEPATADQFGLTHGNVYPIKVFHAERKICGSSFRLTLSGFSTGSSVCRPTCGDGIVGLGEECDDGVNDGGQGECSPGCVRGTYCGDGIVQLGEDCDDGNAVDGDGCGSACRTPVIK